MERLGNRSVRSVQLLAAAPRAALPQVRYVRTHERNAHEEHERPGYGLPVNFLERAFLSTGSALGLLLNPSRADLLTILTQTSSYPNIESLVEQMRSTDEGRRLLVARPSLNSQTINIEELSKLPDGTFGREWVRWLHANRVGPDGRCEARYMPSLETRYVIQRYRETHDFYHTLLGMSTSSLGETVVKYFELAHMQLPVAALATVGGTVRILNDDRRMYFGGFTKSFETSRQLAQLASWAWTLGRNVRKPLISIEWEKRWDQNIDSLREELGIATPPPFRLDIGVGTRTPTHPMALVNGRRFHGWPSKVWERHGKRQPTQ